MSNVLGTYSGKDVNVTIQHPYIDPIQIGGVQELGMAQLQVRMTVDQSDLQVGMDGAVVPSVRLGDQGTIEIQVWQTSTLQGLFINWYNLLRAARDQGNVSEWYGGFLVAQSITDGATHTARGVTIQKVPDKTYAEQAGRVSWILVACDISNENL